MASKERPSSQPEPLDYEPPTKPTRSQWVKDQLLLGGVGFAFGTALVVFLLWWFLYR